MSTTTTSTAPPSAPHKFDAAILEWLSVARTVSAFDKIDVLSACAEGMRAKDVVFTPANPHGAASPATPSRVSTGAVRRPAAKTAASPASPATAEQRREAFLTTKKHIEDKIALLEKEGQEEFERQMRGGAEEEEEREQIEADEKEEHEELVASAAEVEVVEEEGAAAAEEGALVGSSAEIELAEKAAEEEGASEEIAAADAVADDDKPEDAVPDAEDPVVASPGEPADESENVEPTAAEDAVEPVVPEAQE